MNPQPQFSQILSPERLASFQATPNEPVDLILERYLWNIRLCESLYPVIHFLEVCLRNQTHNALRPYFGDDWLIRTGNKACLRDPEQEDVAKVIKRLRRDRKAITPGRVIAGLNLGFWVFLFSKHYDYMFWRKNLRYVFPSYTKKQADRKAIQEKLIRIWALRNRVSHHEPIWNKSDLNSTYHIILSLIEGLSPEALPYLEKVDRFPKIMAQPLTKTDSA